MGAPNYGNGVIGENTSTHDPDFQDPGSVDYRLSCGSPCVNAGDPDSLTNFYPDDEFDLDGNSTLDEPTPDLDLLERDNGTLDMGAYEGVDSCCPGDQNHSGQVDVNDLLAVITTWGPCPSGCIGDIFPDTCIDGTVNINDLLLVVTHWGPCPPQCTDDGGPNSPLDLEDAYDCMELATSLNLEPYSEDWIKFVEVCIEEMLED